MKSPFDVTRPEGQRTEYKCAAALDQTRIVPRAVAAMLNSGGGDVWIGVREKAELPSRIEGVENPSAELRRLQDVLCDLLEPAWSPAFGTIEAVEHGDTYLLVVRCRNVARNGPFAVLGAGGREFPLRVGARVRSMSREELAEAFSRGSPPGAGVATKVIEEFRAHVTDRRRFDDRFWMLATPDESCSLPFDDEPFRRGVEELLTRPERSGNRPSGFGVVRRLSTARTLGTSSEVGARDDPNGWLALDASATLRFHAPLDVPAFNTPLHQEKAFWPYALCELPASFLRLLDCLYEIGGVPGSTAISIDIGLVGARGWTLAPFSPRAIGHRLHEKPLDRDEILWSDPLRTTRSKLREPDRVAWHAVTRIYREFGHEGDVLPREWNRETRRLELGD